MRGKTIFVIALAIFIGIAWIGILQTEPVSAQGPTVFMNSTGNGTTPLLVFPRVAYNGLFFVYVKIKGTMHLTGEAGTGPGGTNPTDLTWAYQVSIHWNPAVLSLASTDIVEPAKWSGTTSPLARNFLKFNYWYTDGADWYADVGYSTSFAPSLDATAGTAVIGNTLLAQDPGKPWNFIEVPPEMNPLDVSYVPGCPDEGFHDGIYYDLPYSVTDRYDLLVRLRFKNLDPGGTGGTASSIIQLIPGPLDTKIKTIGQEDVIPTCISSYYGSSEPEFPLGVGILMSVVVLVPIVYVWRTRSKKKVD